MKHDINPTGNHTRRRGAPILGLTLAAAITVAVAVPALLSGCSADPVTAESLMAGVPEIDPELYSDVSIAVAVSTGGDDGQGMAVSMGVESMAGIRHIYGGEAVIGSGENAMSIGMEGWVDGPGGITYTNLSYGGLASGWTKSRQEGAGGGAVDAAGAVDALPAIWDGASFSLSTDKGTGHYAVEWDVDAAAMAEAAGTMGGAADLDDFGTMSGTASFSRRDRQLESIRVDATNQSGGQFLFYAVFNDVNDPDRELSVPQEIADTAIDGDDPSVYEPKLTDGGWYTYDDGEDAYIDGVAGRLAEAAGEDGWVLANHHDSFSQAAFECIRDGSAVAMDLQKAAAADYPDLASDTYEAQAEWMLEAYGEDSTAYRSDRELLIIVGHKTLAYAVLLEDQGAVAAVEITCEGDPEDDAAALERLDWLLDAAGLPERGNK